MQSVLKTELIFLIPTKNKLTLELLIFSTYYLHY